jgi:predicted lipoprotein
MTMIPDWDTIQSVWPLLVGLAALWARIEVALAAAKAQSKSNEHEIAKLEVKVEAQIRAAAVQAVQLARIEEAVMSMRGDLGRVISGMDRQRGGRD